MLNLATQLRFAGLAPGLALAFSLAAPAGAVTISAADLGAGGTSVVLADATVNAIGGVFSQKTEFGFTGAGVGGGFVGGEIDTSGESIEFDFNLPVVLSSLDLSLLFAAPNHEDRVNEIAKVVVNAGGANFEGLLTVTGETTATWSFVGGGAVSNISIGNQTGAGVWSIANPFGDLAVETMTLLPVDASGDADYRNADYAFGGLTGTAIPEPGTMLLVGAGLAGLGLAGRKRA